MKFGIGAIAAGLQLISAVSAYSLSEGSVKVGASEVHLGEMNTQEIKQLAIDLPKDKIELELKLEGVADLKPHQLVVTLADRNGLDLSFVPAFVAQSLVAKLSILVSKIPAALRSQEKLYLSLIVADADEKNANLLKQLVEIIPSESLRESAAYKPAPRIGIKPEIHHIFREDAKTVNPVIPVAFIGGAVALFLLLVGSWGAYVGENLFGVAGQLRGVKAVHGAGFLGSVVGFEVTFVRYYLGSTIFTTLFHCFLLGGPSIYFGAKVLKTLSEQRKAGRV